MSSIKREDRVEESQLKDLKGWDQIAQFLGQPRGVAQRWAREGMPTSKNGRYVTASPEELNAWLGRQSGLPVPVHIAGNDQDLSNYLRAGLKQLKKSKAPKAKRAA
jgi:hypothetical protein